MTMRPLTLVFLTLLSLASVSNAGTTDMMYEAKAEMAAQRAAKRQSEKDAASAKAKADAEAAAAATAAQEKAAKDNELAKISTQKVNPVRAEAKIPKIEHSTLPDGKDCDEPMCGDEPDRGQAFDKTTADTALGQAKQIASNAPGGGGSTPVAAPAPNGKPVDVNLTGPAPKPGAVVPPSPGSDSEKPSDEKKEKGFLAKWGPPIGGAALLGALGWAMGGPVGGMIGAVAGGAIGWAIEHFFL